MGSRWVCPLKLFLLYTFDLESIVAMVAMRNMFRSLLHVGENFNVDIGIKHYGPRLVDGLRKVDRGRETFNNCILLRGSTEASKRSAYHYDLWNMKYLKRFKWDNLTEEIGTWSGLLSCVCRVQPLSAICKSYFLLFRLASFL